MSESNYYEFLSFADDGLVDLPAVIEVWNHIRHVEFNISSLVITNDTLKSD